MIGCPRKALAVCRGLFYELSFIDISSKPVGGYRKLLINIGYHLLTMLYVISVPFWFFLS